ncbi:sensor histidine kinase [Kitasatospora sp. NPDC001175]|uniref:sensor histidine kinase n=1 Tax=Kitasatospora sp. NPDC001175 TaxID=3157103 RepID=UPI003CFE842C
MAKTAELRTAARKRALPGPWGRREYLREGTAALLVAVLSGIISLADPMNPLGAIAVGLAAAALYLLRRGLPLTVLLLTAVGLGAFGGCIPILAAASWSAGYRMARAWALTAACASVLVLSTAVSLRYNLDGIPPRGLIGINLAVFLLFVVLPAVFGRYRAQRRTLLSTLQERNDQLLRERAMIAHQARLRERQRIAQDMHDSLGHQLALISVHTGALEVDRGLTDRQREAVAVLRQAAVTAMRELRETVGLLRDENTVGLAGSRGAAGTAGDTGAAGGVETIERLTDASRAAGTAVRVTRSGEIRPLAAATGHAAYRIVQEALTNAHKHAPSAPIEVALRYEPDALLVEVVNGASAATAPGPVVSGGQGLTGLRERARLLGGMVHSGPTPEGGFRLAGVLPYEGAGRPPADDPDLPEAPPPAPPVRRSPALGCAVVVGLACLAFLGLLGFGGYVLVEETDNATLDRDVYDAVQVGQPESAVKDKLPSGSDFLTSGYRQKGPDVPAGASCLWFSAEQRSDEPAGDYASRLCFRDGVLIEKVHYRA